MRNWRTTLTGVFTIIITALGIYGKKTVSPEDVAALTAGAGLILAKDAGVTGVVK